MLPKKLSGSIENTEEIVKLHIKPNLCHPYNSILKLDIDNTHAADMAAKYVGNSFL